ncbi:hypothetical protein FJ420_12680 [Mesorhizobium sp. B3-1-3]|uniref:hypothetical protein n=1 Tax=unclassified Mesorhizobium TaxID=325217 RepID=UPI00112ABDFE|nr:MULTISPECIES: hypothetical protein [unclassified Mesorhizobium]TPI57642.1 hypothetical protein FJ417_21270 [Mesorhizobium sp. B3-1-7]TPI63435.1 hypothetical protein FJ424_19485 [Mesorhizobium sp. B3-1-8]TPI72216.1 hypothetical protein FJ420_12680 [Mesorhizobium sp. B3-1-3]TPJ37017.1 hypothetical protein FJ418_01735 [Mesorhizobium sp. B2-8-3]
MRLASLFGAMDEFRSHSIQLYLEDLLRTRMRAERLMDETGSAIAQAQILLQQSRVLLDRIERDRSLYPLWRNAQGAGRGARRRK